MTDRSKILDMLSKMDRLSKDPGAFQGEANAAMAKMQELMEKYAISQMDLQNHLADKQEKEFSQAFTSVPSEFKHKNIQSWEWSLARLIAEVTMTRCYSSGMGMYKKFGVHANFVFFGTEEAAKTAGELYALWHKNIEEMAETARWANVLELKKKYGHYPKFRHWIKQNRPDEDPQYFRSSWITGCINAMRQTVYEEQKAREQQQEQSTAGSALVLYKNEVDKAYDKFRSVAITMKKGPKGSKGFSSSGYEQGVRTGRKIKIGSKGLED